MFTHRKKYACDIQGGKFSEWNHWSACSSACGKGISTRERILPPSNNEHCYSAIIKEKQCQGFDCKVVRNFTNMAIGKPTNASSSLFGRYPSSRAVDGNSNTTFNSKSCMHTDKDLNPFLRIDLQKQSVVEMVLIWNRGDCCSERLNNVKVTVGDDPTGMNNLLCGSAGNTTEVNPINVKCSSILSGQYVHIRIPGPQFLTICEVEVIGSDIRNLASGQPASQSNTETSFTASNAVDGDNSTDADTGAGQKDPWLQIDLGQIYSLKQVDVLFYTNFVNLTLTIVTFGSNQNQRLNEVCEQKQNLGKAGKVTFVCEKEIAGRYLTIQEFSDNTRLDIYEVEAFEFIKH